MRSLRWVGAAVRSCIWIGFATWWAYLKKPEGGGFLQAVGVLGGWLVVAGLGLHFWSSLTLARAELAAPDGVSDLVARGPLLPAGSAVAPALAGSLGPRRRSRATEPNVR